MSPSMHNEDEFLVWVHIPQMRTELMQGGLPQKSGTWLGGQIILSAQNASGKYENSSPVTQIKMQKLVIRPNYMPIKQDSEYQPREPDNTLSPAKPNNALGRVLLGVFMGSGNYCINGTCAPSSIGTLASGGCIRVENEAVERIAHILLDSIPIQSITDEGGNAVNPRTPFNQLLGTRQQYEVQFQKPYRIRVTYQLWNEQMNFTDRELGMAVYPDIYGRLQARVPPVGCPEDKNNEGNSYTYGHFVRDLKKNGIGPALGVGEEAIRQVWEDVKNKMIEFSLGAVKNDEKGVGYILKKEGWISVPVSVLVKGGSWEKIEEEKNKQKIIGQKQIIR